MNKLEIYQHLQTLLPGAELVITGSTALKELGLVPQSNVIGDLDLLVRNLSGEGVAILENLQKEKPGSSVKGEEYADSSHLSHSFILDGIKVDIFRYKDNEKFPWTIKICSKGFFANPSWIIGEMKRINSVKHWMKVRQIAQTICSDTEWDLLVKPTPVNSLR